MKRQEKINNDKYYTSKSVVLKCVELVKEHIGLKNITQFI
jgi:hypothetical protein